MTETNKPQETETKNAAKAKVSAKTKFEKAKARRKIVNSIMGFIVFCILLGALSGFSIIKVILSKTDVVLNADDLSNTDSSLIYDDQGEQIAIVGEENRISYSYNRMPQVVIDAFVAVEDSRFFEHPGFDLPRFAKAFLENIRTLSFSQGGSTLTMQVIKNTYFAVDTIAEKSIARKVQEIYYSLKINDIVSKEKILQLYINKINFGASARGIQVASQYYFGKDCTQLNLVEAAMLAGLVNSPNKTNPYTHLDKCKERTNTVLYQMANHGYISNEEYEMAKKVKIENLLSGKVTQEYGTGTTVDYQAYIDVVLAELSDVYNINPYTTPVKVYTAMNKTVQHYCDEVSRGNVVEFSDQYVNTSVVLIQNYTGLIVGLCGGRDYDGVRMFNYAYDNRINPGSTAKGVFTYPLAFEYCDLGTNYTVYCEPMTWIHSSKMISEDHGYEGEISIQRAFTTSMNIAAVKMFRWVEQTAGVETMKEYMKSIGIDKNVYDNINEQYAIGEQHFLVSPIQLCAAESVILSQGQYTQPHTITRIEFINSTNEPIVAKQNSTQVLSDGAAWLVKYLQQLSVNGGATAEDWSTNGRLNYIKNSKYTVYGKTGTSLYDATIRKKYKMPSNATKDWLMVGGTNDYSFAFWMGYDTGQYIDSTTYIKASVKSARQDGKIVSGLLNASVEAFGKPVNSNNKPSSVTTITHIRGVYPYTAPPAYANADQIVTSYILASHANVESYAGSIDSLTSMDASYDEASKKVTVSFAPYPDADLLQVAPVELEMEFRNKTYTGKRRYHRTWLDGVVEYNVAITNNTTGETVYHASGSPTATYVLENNTESDITYTVSGYYAFTIADIRSNSINRTITVKGKEPEPVIEPDPTPVPIDQNTPQENTGDNN